MRRAALLAGLLAMGAAVPLHAQTRDPGTEAEHIVQPGETLGGIAARAGVPRSSIIEANRLQAPYPLRAGQKLVIPRHRTHTVKDGETGFGIAMDQGVPWARIAAASGIDPKAPVKAGQRLTIPASARTAPAPIANPAPAPSPTPSAPPTAAATAAPRLVWPVSGKVRRAYAPRKGGSGFHDGIDIIAPGGTAARASAAGEVIFAGEGPKEYGLTVIVHHGGRWTTTYSFLQRVTVKEGDTVRSGERVGLVGQTGLATEPQLHFEVRRNREALDPAKYLPAR